MKAIMYHYVREFDETHPNFIFLDVKMFKCLRDVLRLLDAGYGPNGLNRIPHGPGRLFSLLPGIAWHVAAFAQFGKFWNSRPQVFLCSYLSSWIADQSPII